MIRFFKKLFKRGDFMTRADKAYYKYRAKTIFWSAFCLIIIAWVGTNLVLCALTTDVKSNFDIGYEAAEPVVLPTGKDFNRMLKKSDTFLLDLVDNKIQNLTFDKFTDGVEDKYLVGGVNVLAGAAKETISADNQIYLYRTTDLANVYILSNHKMQANPDSSYMFFTLSVTSYTFNNFDTSKVQSLNNMFSGLAFGAYHKTNYTIDQKNLLTAQQYAGSFSPWIETLDLSTWKTSNVTDMGQMFNKCGNLTTIYVSGRFVVDQVETSGNMFDSCSKLVGGQGTACNGTANIDKTYARIDGKDGLQGYFTEKAYSGK